MTGIDTIVLGILLMASIFAAAGTFAYRAQSKRGPQSGPFWYWAWSVLLLAGISSEAAPELSFLPPLLSPVFSALLVAGAFRYAGKPAPSFLILAGVALGLMRLGAESLDLVRLSGLLALAFEPAAAAYTAWLVHKTAREWGASWLHRALPIGFAAIAVVELLGAMRPLSGAERVILWPFWLAAALPVLGLQIVLSLQRQKQAEDRSDRDQGDRDAAIERLNLLTSHTRDIISEIGPDGRLALVSESVREKMGVEPEELIGELPRHLMEKFRVREVERFESETGEHKGGLHSMLDGMGRLRWFETEIVRAGRESRTLLVSRDVTERVLAEHELSASEERFRKFSLLGSDYCFEAIGSLEKGVENWITGNLEEISGYTQEELERIGFAGFIHPDDVAAGRDRVLALLDDDGGESSHEFRLLTKSGDVRWIAENILVERQGAEFRIYGAARDITEERRTEQALARAQKLDSLGLLAGGIAHDFNNLLTVIVGHAEIVLAETSSAAERREDVQSIVEASEQARALTQQLLAYAGRGAVERVPLDLSERVRSVSELLSSSRPSGVDLQLELSEDLPAVVADPGEIQQVAMNLVLNAIEACEGEGSVRVTTRRVTAEDVPAGTWVVGESRAGVRWVALEVGDTGIGMSPQTLERVFDPFFTTKSAGRGLGLAAVIGIVRSADGGLTVDSHPDRGTTFSVLLPASDRAAGAPSRGGRTPTPSPSRVLVVDDEERVLRVIARLLTRRGFTVETVADGKSALDAYHRDPFDLVILDAVMPGMSGAETFDELRRIHPEAVVLMASGYTMEHAVGDLLERGLNGFIGKPFRADELFERIHALLDS